MPEEIVMPRLSDTMQQGTIVRWLKKEGDTVAKDEVVAEVETDKAIMELQSYVAGTIERILVPEGGSAPIGAPIAVVRLPQEAPSEKAAVQEVRQVRPAPPETPQVAPEAPVERRPGETRVKASPLARRIAEEMGVDLSQVAGTGEGGRITREDVLAYVQQRKAHTEVQVAAEARAVIGPTEPVERPLGHIQKVIARRMVESKSTVPHFYVTIEVDMDAALRLRDEINAALREHDLEISVNDMFLKAVGLALRAMPEVNASYSGDKLLVHQRVNVGIAVGTDDLLLVPVIKDCDKKGLREIAVESRDLIGKARAGKLSAQDVEGGTFTVSNLGMYGVDEFNAIVNPPQAAILAVGAVHPKPVALEGQVVIRQRARLALSADHRVFYGVTAAKFLGKVREFLERPLLLLL